METTTTTLTNAIAELTAQVEQLTRENANLREVSMPGNDKSSEVISSIIKTIPRETILEVLGVKDVNLEDVDSAVLIDYVSENYGVDEVFSKRQIIEYIHQNESIDEIYDLDDITEWVKDNRTMSDIYDVDCVTEWSLDDVLMEFGEEVVMQEIANQGWSKQNDVSDIISTLEDVIESLKA